jgi:hypothetical protein
MDSALEIKLIECLDALESGEALEQILARYPQDAAALRPALETALALPRLQIEPSLAAKSASRDAFLSHANAMRKARPVRQSGTLTQMLRGLATLALVLIIGGAALVSLSSPALPGDALYGVKRAVEELRLSLAADRATLAEQLEQTRRDEVATLIAAGRMQEVEFSGIIESMQGDVWQVSALTVLLNSSTQLEGDPQIGRRAHVRGLTGANRIDARTIRVEGGDQPVPTTTPSPTPLPSNTPAPTLTITMTPSASAMPSLTPTPSPSSTFTPVITIAASSTPTGAPPTPGPPSATPADNGNENENGNENGNGNGNDNENEGGNENSNDNDNENGNDNSNDDDNDNSSGPGNGNDNDNDNGN